MEPSNFYVSYTNPGIPRSNATAANAFGLTAPVNAENHIVGLPSSGGSPTAAWIGFLVFLGIMAVITRLPSVDKDLDPRNIDINGFNVLTMIVVFGASWGGFKLLANMLAQSKLGNNTVVKSFNTFVNYV